MGSPLREQHLSTPPPPGAGQCIGVLALQRCCRRALCSHCLRLASRCKPAERPNARHAPPTHTGNYTHTHTPTHACACRELRLVGGGAQNHLWRRVVADAFQLPLRIPAEPEAAAFGAALQVGGGVVGAALQVRGVVVVEVALQVWGPCGRRARGSTGIRRCR